MRLEVQRPAKSAGLSDSLNCVAPALAVICHPLWLAFALAVKLAADAPSATSSAKSTIAMRSLSFASLGVASKASVVANENSALGTLAGMPLKSSRTFRSPTIAQATLDL